MHYLISTCAIILFLLCVISIHELGHALAAKFCKIKISQINIGFGEALYTWQTKSGCTIKLGWCLIGGRVTLLNTRTAKVDTKLHASCFDKKPTWIKILVLLSGSVANIIAAYLALVIMLMLGSKQLQPNIESVQANSFAAEAGLTANCKITKIANIDTPYFRDVAMQIIQNLGKDNVNISYCSEDNRCQSASINLNIWQQKPSKLDIFTAIGFKPQSINTSAIYVPGVNFPHALREGWTLLLKLSKFFAIMLKQIIMGNIPFAALLGPFKFFEAVIDSFWQGLATFLYFIGNFSLAMAFANLLPIPTLDGGSIIYTIIEKLRGQPMSVALEVLIYRLTFTALGIFLVQLLVNDLKYYF